MDFNSMETEPGVMKQGHLATPMYAESTYTVFPTPTWRIVHLVKAPIHIAVDEFTTEFHSDGDIRKYARSW